MSSIHTITASLGSEKYKTTLTNGNNSIFSDELIANGGAEKGFTPTELLCSALASCTVITLKMYTDHKQWNVGEIKANVTYQSPEADKPGYFNRELSFEHAITNEQSERLITVAGKCPIHKILSQGHQINTNLI